MNEATLTKNLGALIRKRGGWARKTHGGIHGAGWPDLICVYRGVPLWLEVKLPGKEKNLTNLQAQVLREAKAAGAVALVVTSRSQVTALLDKIDERRGVSSGHSQSAGRQKRTGTRPTRAGRRPGHARGHA